LLAGAYCVEFILFGPLSDTLLGFAGALAISALVGFVISCAVLHYDRRTWGITSLGLVAFFLIGYPLLALAQEQATMLRAMVDSAFVVYLAFLYARRKPRPAET